jgi:hypothetical protein
MESIDNVQSSNFSGGSFVLENTGGKQIAAVLIDFRSALYGDSIVDPNGLGGDTTAKPFVIDGGGAATGASFDQTDAYQFPGDAPIPQPGVPSNGGFRGLLLKTDGTGFGPGETVTFSGDMDPNSIAAIAKNVVDAGAINSWDVGGVSGAELIGSSFTVMFDDGTFATGYLGSNGTQAGSVGEAVENRPDQVATVTVNGFDSSEAGTYGGAVPTIVVNGPAGATVLVTLSKGLNPVTNTANGTADLVADRLDATHPDFPVSNAADFQTFTVTLDGSGSATLPSGAFAYNAPDGGQSFSGSAFTPGFATAPIVVSASVVDGEDNPLGPVDRVYLTNPTGTPVADGGGPNPGVQGYFELVGTGTAAYFKMEIEDARIANGGTDPGGKWTFVDTAVGGNQTGFTGDGYYVYGSPANTAVNGVIGSEVLEYTIFVPQNETGTFAFQFRVSRDGVAPSDQQNDLWLNFKPASAPGAGNIENFLVGLGGSTGQEPEPTSNGYIKIFGGPNNGTWGTASNYDGLPNNPAAQISITEGGFYTIQIAGRSEGFHVDSFWLAKIGGSTPGPLSPNSPFVVTDPNAPAAPVISGGTTAIVLEGTSVALDVDATDANGDALTYSITGGADQSLFSINSTTGVVTFNTPPDFENPADSGGNNVYNIQVTVSDGALTDSENYAITVTDDPSDNPVVSGPLLTFEVLNGSTIVDGDLENGDSVNELALGDTPLFSGTLEQGEAGSVFLELLDGSGIVLDTQIENNSPFDLNYNGPAIADGNYTLRATFYAQDNLSGGIVGTQEIDFAVVDAESGPTDFRIEAEDLTLESGFGVFSQGSFTLIRLPQNNPGGPSAVASTILADVVPGLYSVRVLAYNENDGEGEFQVTVGDDVFAFVTLDESIGGNVGDSGQVGNRVLIDLGVIEIDESDEFELVYNPIGNEVGRFDYIDFIAVDDPLQN